ncbi:MAG: hypothetical protein AMJ61_15370 [Desulfobacterales bacterium SG8_35_2]|nr:MAG: hypothetical protein AMJ61_15370 [Desulfobacterales bacterium SG8_35_2]
MARQALKNVRRRIYEASETTSRSRLNDQILFTFNGFFPYPTLSARLQLLFRKRLCFIDSRPGLALKNTLPLIFKFHAPHSFSEPKKHFTRKTSLD